MSNTLTPQAGQAPASNVAAVCTMAAPTDGTRWRVRSVSWSYSATPTGGTLIFAWSEGGSDYTETYYIPVAGPGVLNFDSPKEFPANVQVVVTLHAGGSGIYGTVYPVGETGF